MTSAQIKDAFFKAATDGDFEKVDLLVKNNN